MLFLDFDKDYQHQVIQRFQRTGIAPPEFIEWLQASSTIAYFKANSPDRIRVKNSDHIDKTARKDRDKFRGGYNRGDVYHFKLSHESFDKLDDIRALFQATAEALTRKISTPAGVNLQTLQRRKITQLLDLYAAWRLRQKNGGSGALHAYAMLDHGFALRVIDNTQEAIILGEHLHNCLRDLAPGRRPTVPMTAYLDAIKTNNLLGLQDSQGHYWAYLRFSDKKLLDIRGPMNGGLVYDDAIALRAWVLNNNVPVTEIAAAYIGLVLDEREKLVPYETQLPRLLGHHDMIDISFLPIRDHELVPLTDRTLRQLKMIHCANISALPEGLNFSGDSRSGVLLAHLREQHDRFLDIKEARAMLEASYLRRPKRLHAARP